VSRSTQSKSSSNKPRQVRDAEATKAQILDAAMEEFAKHGLSGARTEAIASRSGVTKAMIYYYFDSKEKLYQAVLHRLDFPINDMLRETNLDNLPAEEALKQVIQAAIAYRVQHPHLGMILFQEANQNQGKFYKQTNWQEGFEQVISILERGIREGCFRPVDPFLTAIHIAAVCTFYFDAYENLKYVKPDLDLRSQEMIEQYTQHAINLILAGVRFNAQQ